jgi:tetratricopeptide (TPR) repeat protein
VQDYVRYYSIAVNEYNRGHYNESLAAADKVLEIANANSDSNHELGYRSSSLEVKAHAYDALGRRRDAISCLEEAIGIDERRTDADEGQVATSCVSLAIILLQLNESEKAVAYCERARLSSLRGTQLTAKLLNMAAVVYGSSAVNNYEKAKTLLIRAKKISETNKEDPPHQLLISIRWLGYMIVNGEDDSDKALEMYESCWRLIEKHGQDYLDQEELYHLVSFASATLGDLLVDDEFTEERVDRHLKWLTRGIRPVAALLDRNAADAAMACSYLAAIYLAFETSLAIDKTATIERARTLLKLVTEGHMDLQVCASAEWLLGYLHTRTPNWPDANDLSAMRGYKHLRSALKILDASGQNKSALYGVGRGLVGEVHLAKGDLARAAADFKVAVNILEGTAHPNNQAVDRYRKLYAKATKGREEE